LALAHNFVIVAFVLAIFQPPIGWPGILMVIPAFAVVILNGVWISLLFGMMSARYRDIPPIVTSIVQMLLFVTPIFWQYEQLGAEGWWVQLNPLFAAVDVMRAPLVGKATAPFSWGIMLLATMLGCGGTFAFFARFRRRLPFWV
jgi:ABC-type polysaccharide/polyol phosphate export permease